MGSSESGTVRAWIGTVLFLFVGPGVVAGLVPWLITRWRLPAWEAWAWVVVPVSAAMIGAGIGFLLYSFGLFAAQGRGTPAPVAPTERLVVGGAYRWVRNPMYLCIGTIILGQALLFASWQLAAYASLVVAAVAVFVRFYEERVLLRRYGDDYQRFLDTVPRWLPRRPR